MKQSENSKPIVYVVDDDMDVRQGLSALMESIGLDCKVFASAQEFFEEQPLNSPSCLVLDVRLQGTSGLDVQMRLAKAQMEIPIIFMTAHGDIPMSVQAMKAGAVEFLLKPVREQELLDAVHVALDRDRARRRADEELRELKMRFESLSHREREILSMVTSGMLNKQIAAEMGLSEVTVKVHRHNLMKKLAAKNVPDLVRMADNLGVCRPPQN